MHNLIGEDIKLMRARYDEALQLRGVPCQYKFPIFPDTNNQGESVVDSYSLPIDTFIFFEGSTKIKTFKRYGWVVANDSELPFLIHCSFNLDHVQKDSIFEIAGQYTELPKRTFRVTEISYDIQAPDHIVCQVVPIYEKQKVGRTEKEVQQTFNKSEHFIKQPVDYRGNYVEKSSRHRLVGKPESFLGNVIGTSEGSSMLKVSDSEIQITRGDTGYFNLSITDNSGSLYTRQEGDKLEFTVKKTTNSKDSLIHKDVEDLLLTILPEDTEGIPYGTYKYDVQLTTNTGQVFTVIGPSTFTIRNEVTF